MITLRSFLIEAMVSIELQASESGDKVDGRRCSKPLMNFERYYKF